MIKRALAAGVVAAVMLSACTSGSGESAVPSGSSAIGGPSSGATSSGFPSTALKPRECELFIPAGEVEGDTVRCGYVEVPWDRTKPGGTKARLAYVVLKATKAQKASEAVVHISGGPGASATQREAMGEFFSRYSVLREKRDIVLYDQRGIGRSEPFFECSGNGSGASKEAIAATAARIGRKPTAAELATAQCEAEWATKGFPTANLSTATSAADLNDVLAALGYPAYALYGISYGTRLAMATMNANRANPQISSVVLDSSYPLPEDTANDLAAVSFLAKKDLLGDVFDQCAADAACAKDYPDLRARYDALLAKARRAPVGTYGGKPVTAEVIEAAMFPYRPMLGSVPWIPRLVATLEKGDTSILEVLDSGAVPENHNVLAMPPEPAGVSDLVSDFYNCRFSQGSGYSDERAIRDVRALWDAPRAEASSEISRICAKGAGGKQAADRLVTRLAGLPDRALNYLLIREDREPRQGSNSMINRKMLCTEQLPFAPSPEAVEAELKASGLPQAVVSEALGAIAANTSDCVWSDAMKAPTEAAFGDYPVLILQGELDPVTPPAYGKMAKRQLPDAQYVTVPWSTHSVLGNNGECPSRVVEEFLDDPSAAVDASCLKAIKVPWIGRAEPLPAVSGSGGSAPGGWG